MCFEGSSETPGGGGNREWAFLVDGAFPSGLSSSVGVVAHGVGDGRPLNMHGCYRNLTISAGSHDFCFSGRVNAGTMTCYSGTRCVFNVRAFN